MQTHHDIADTVIHTMDDNISRFKKYGKMLTRTVSRGKEKGKIGQLGEKVFIVFYPDGSYERFENGPGSVQYRPGWSGPDLTSRGKTITTIVKEIEAVIEVAKPESPKKSRSTKKMKSSVSPGWAATIEMVTEMNLINDADSSQKKERSKKVAAKAAARRALHGAEGAARAVIQENPPLIS